MPGADDARKIDDLWVQGGRVQSERNTAGSCSERFGCRPRENRHRMAVPAARDRRMMSSPVRVRRMKRGLD
jgi:hypothetical protein